MVHRLIHGSDAIAGVVNIIPARTIGVPNWQPPTARPARETAQQRYGLTVGWGDPAKDRFNAMAVLDFFKREATWARDREFSRSADQRARGGSTCARLRAAQDLVHRRRGGFSDKHGFPGNCPAESIGLFSG